jgi:hypothetical protein
LDPRSTESGEDGAREDEEDDIGGNKKSSPYDELFF